MSRDNLFHSQNHENEHPFQEPWQAHAFANAVMLHEKGLFTWPEWAETLGAVVAEAGPDDDTDNYYHHWMAALERIVEAKAIVADGELAKRKSQWDRAARATPHGRPILLEAYPLAKV